MEVISSFLNGAKLLKPQIYEDNRGYFFESYNQKTFESLGIKTVFVQDNESFSEQGVLRGLHFQKSPFAQAKLLWVCEGEIEDFIVDLRAGSPSFAQYKKIILSAENKLRLFVPVGFAHGFFVRKGPARLNYKCGNFYNPSCESGIRYDDKTLNIAWDFGNIKPVLSAKDLALPSFEEYQKNAVFKYEE